VPEKYQTVSIDYTVTLKTSKRWVWLRDSNSLLSTEKAGNVPRGRTELSDFRALQKRLLFWTSRSVAQWGDGERLEL